MKSATATTKLTGKTKTTELRNPYYQLSDAIGGFYSSVNDKDVKLKELAKKMHELQSEIHSHLESNYIWD